MSRKKADQKRNAAVEEFFSVMTEETTLTPNNLETHLVKKDRKFRGYLPQTDFMSLLFKLKINLPRKVSKALLTAFEFEDDDDDVSEAFDYKLFLRHLLAVHKRRQDDRSDNDGDSDLESDEIDELEDDDYGIGSGTDDDDDGSSTGGRNCLLYTSPSPRDRG